MRVSKSFVLVVFVLSSPLSFSVFNDRCKSIFDAPKKANVLQKKSKTSTPQLEGANQVVHALIARNMKQVNRLVQEYPHLKDKPITDVNLIQRIVSREDINWNPRGWKLIQLAAYMRDILMLEYFLELGSPYRTIKKAGGVSVDNNPLHISIKRDFVQGMKLILSSVPYFDPTKKKGHFIDEKDQGKHTPWYMAIRKDMKRIERGENLLFTPVIALYRPSGEVESYDPLWGPIDGLVMAYRSGSEAIVNLARRHLRISPWYGEHKAMKRQSPYKRTQAPSFYY